jgi:hypothetical protein
MAEAVHLRLLWTAVLVAAEQAAQEQLQEMATRQVHRHLKEIMVAPEERQTFLTLALAAGVGHLLLEETGINRQVAVLLRVMEEMALHLLSLAAAWRMLAAVVVGYKQQLAQQALLEQVVLVAAQTEQKIIQMPHLELPILAVVAAVAVKFLVPAARAATAVQVS